MSNQICNNSTIFNSISQASADEAKKQDSGAFYSSKHLKTNKMPFEIEHHSAEDTPKLIEKDFVKPKVSVIK